MDISCNYENYEKVLIHCTFAVHFRWVIHTRSVRDDSFPATVLLEFWNSNSWKRNLQQFAALRRLEKYPPSGQFFPIFATVHVHVHNKCKCLQFTYKCLFHSWFKLLPIRTSVEVGRDVNMGNNSLSSVVKLDCISNCLQTYHPAWHLQNTLKSLLR